jgi:reactive intermediate/imine deaminase
MKLKDLLKALMFALALTGATFSQVTAKEIHSTDALYPAVGPYSQMVQAGNLLFFSGVIPLNKAGDAVVGDTVEEQTRVVLDYIGAKLESQGLGFENVVMSHVFMADLKDFGVMNGVYAEYFHTDPPARATVEAARLPRDVLIEIAVVAYKP